MPIQLIDAKTFSEFHKEVTALNNLIQAINKREIPEATIQKVEQIILDITTQAKPKKSKFRSGIQKILSTLEKDCKLVAKNYYRQLWMVLGLSVFGVPLGTTFGLLNDNMALLGIGIPIGMAIGIGLGINMDKNAEKKGLVLDFEFKY